MSVGAKVLLGCALALLGLIVLFLKMFLRYVQNKEVEEEAAEREEQEQRRRQFRLGRQENDVWNISGRVHNHEQWPTHDHHISIDSYVFPSESKDPRLAPPAYSEVGLPTYEEAINASNSHKATTLPAPVHTVVQIPRENS